LFHSALKSSEKYRIIIEIEGARIAHYAGVPGVRRQEGGAITLWRAPGRSRSCWDTTLRQQRELAALVDTSELVLKTAVLEQVVDTWPMTNPAATAALGVPRTLP
jgi:hypothetical protein